ncbi:MAG: MarR family transcriptional regulator [Novosphingobium sp.]
MSDTTDLPPYPRSLAGTLLAAREAVMAPIRPLLREAGVTDQQWRVLRVLADGGPLDASGIAESALLYAPSVTRIVRELVDRGLLSRATSESDRRRSVIEITPVGRELVGRTAARTARMLVAYGEAFGPERLDRFVLEAAALAAALSRFAPSDAGEGGSDEG